MHRYSKAELDELRRDISEQNRLAIEVAKSRGYKKDPRIVALQHPDTYIRK